jgi:5-(aminomethyl)-3-furanmethanol phosphate kinase
MTGCRVIKLGGSLLDWRELPATLQTWCAQQAPMANVLIVGGGELVEAVRHLDRTHELSQATSHWLAIRTLSVTARLVAGLVEGAVLCERLDQIDLSQREQLQILDVLDFMQCDARSDDPLPATWEVTSDSIAARVAERLQARDLVLLKSAVPQMEDGEGESVEDLAAAGYVDGFFPKCLPNNCRSRCVNLRSSGFDERVILRGERNPALRSG